MVGVDGSEGSRQALHWAAREAIARGGTLQAVVAWWRDRPGAAEPGHARQSVRSKQQAERLLAEAAASLPVEVPVAGQIVEGRAADVLVTAARTADLLVLGCRAEDRPGRPRPNRVAEEVADRCGRPVVVISASSPARPPAVPVRMIPPRRQPTALVGAGGAESARRER